MNRKAIINGREYTLLEIVPSLDGGQALLLCEDKNGKRATCSESLWCSCALTDVYFTSVHAHSSSQEKIEYFLSVFRKPVTPLSAKMNGCMACAIKRNTGAQSVPTVSFGRLQPMWSRRI